VPRLWRRQSRVAAKHGREVKQPQRYGIGQKELDHLLAEQGGVCAICGEDNPEHVDHDHRTGYIRGVLCFRDRGRRGNAVAAPVI
jgi:hypothetical protein